MLQAEQEAVLLGDGKEDHDYGPEDDHLPEGDDDGACTAAVPL